MQGSSAIQLVPALQRKVGRVLNYVRGKTWLALPFAQGKMAELLKRDPTSSNCESTPNWRHSASPLTRAFLQMSSLRKRRRHSKIQSITRNSDVLSKQSSTFVLPSLLS